MLGSYTEHPNFNTNRTSTTLHPKGVHLLSPRKTAHDIWSVWQQWRKRGRKACEQGLEWSVHSLPVLCLEVILHKTLTLERLDSWLGSLTAWAFFLSRSRLWGKQRLELWGCTPAAETPFRANLLLRASLPPGTCPLNTVFRVGSFSMFLLFHLLLPLLFLPHFFTPPTTFQ